MSHDQNVASERETFGLGSLDVGVGAPGKGPDGLPVQKQAPSVLNLKKFTDAPDPLVLGFAVQRGVDPFRFSWI